jgi:general secretion pathway protein G
LRINKENIMKNIKGFTLIEIMVVVIILGLLAGIVLPKILGREEEAKVSAAKVQIKSIESALDGFKLDNGFYPTTDQGFSALIKKPEAGCIPDKWNEGGYLKPARIPKDPGARTTCTSRRAMKAVNMRSFPTDPTASRAAKARTPISRAGRSTKKCRINFGFRISDFGLN